MLKVLTPEEGLNTEAARLAPRQGRLKSKEAKEAKMQRSKEAMKLTGKEAKRVGIKEARGKETKKRRSKDTTKQTGNRNNIQKCQETTKHI